jgi:nitrite reductase/ring-hydroxylating ferredoxin subunit
VSRTVRLCAVDDVPEGQARAFQIDEHPPVAVFNVAGTLHATADTCPHQRASLAEGDIEDDEVICPLHFQVFHIPTGEAREGVTKKCLATYPIRLSGPDVLVELP